jgi:hypothetical protein
MSRLMALILTAGLIMSLITGTVPGQYHDEPVSAKSKSPRTAESFDSSVVTVEVPDEPVPPKSKSSSSANSKGLASKKKSSPSTGQGGYPAATTKAVTRESEEAYIPADRPLSPTEAARRVGRQATVLFTVGSAGSNAAGFLELYSGRTWQEEGSFFIRFPEEAQRNFAGLGISNFRQHFIGKAVQMPAVSSRSPFKPVEPTW